MFPLLRLQLFNIYLPECLNNFKFYMDFLVKDENKNFNICTHNVQIPQTRKVQDSINDQQTQMMNNLTIYLGR